MSAERARTSEERDGDVILQLFFRHVSSWIIANSVAPKGEVICGIAPSQLPARFLPGRSRWQVRAIASFKIELAGTFRQKIPSTYREFFTILEGYASAGLNELRALNPLTRGKPQNEILRDD